MILDKYIELTKEETYAIRWHMGFSEEKGLYGSLGKAMEKYPIVLAIHEADLEASKLLEGEDGNKQVQNRPVPVFVYLIFVYKKVL